MAGKKTNSNENDDKASAQPDEISELTTLRQIVFGAAKAELEIRLSELEKHMQDSFQRSEVNVNQRLQELTNAMQKGVEVLTDKVNTVDKLHEDKNAELQSYADKLSSELEMASTNHGQEADEIHARLDKEVAQLTEKYDARFAEALERLDQVTRELSSTKTDRKTLAKLLATMAINLETDED